MTTTKPRLPRVNDTRILRRTGFEAQVTSLTAAVLQAVDLVPQGCLQSVVAGAAIAYQPRTLLALLTYAYALGIYASSDIEAMMRTDKNFRQLCGNEFAGWKMLRRFRRANIDSVRTCLEKTLQIISKSDRNQNVCFGVVRSNGMQMGHRQSESWDDVQIAAEVNDRLERAIWMDSVAMDECV